jgi:dipeptidyl-peptidase-4
MDDNVHLQNSLALSHALQAAGKQFRLMVYPRVRHGIENRKQQAHLYQMMADFVREKL